MSSKPSRRSPIADDGLSPDKRLALAYVRARHRAAIHVLFAVDGAMGDVLRTTSEPQVGAIRLAWWRERLEELGGESRAPGEPRLQAVERELLPRGIRGRDLAALENGWLRLLDPFPWDAGIAESIWLRGRLLFALGAMLLDRTDDPIEEAGGLWALVDIARHCSDAESRAMLVGQARTFARALAGVRITAPVRPLSMLAVLAIRDCKLGEPLEREGTPGRAAALLRHRLSGRFRAP